MHNDRSANPNPSTVIPNGVEVARLRKQKGWTQQDLAEAAGYSKRKIEAIEAGQPTRPATLKDVADALGVLVTDVCPELRDEFASPVRATLPQNSAALLRFRPRQLPNDLPKFIGRSPEIAAVAARLTGKATGPAPLVAVHGMGGIGKTKLAIHAAHRVQEHFPDGQLFIDLRGMDSDPLSPFTAMKILLRSLCPEMRTPDSPLSDTDFQFRLVADYRSAFATAGRVLLVLDNAVALDQVGQLIPAAPAAAIVTSRHRLSLSEFDATPVPLDVFSPEESLELARSILPKRTDDARLKELVELCGYLPLAIRVASDFLRQRPDWSLPEYCKALRRDGLSRLKTHGDSTHDVEAVLSLSATQLAAESTRLATRWALLAAIDCDFDQEMAAEIWECAPDDPSVLTDLSDLAARSMLSFDAKTRTYQMHDLMRPIANGLFTHDTTQ